MDSKLRVIISPTGVAYPDHQVESICRSYLEVVNNNVRSQDVFISQELMLLMFRALLYKEYSHLQPWVEFYNNDFGQQLHYDSRMRITWELDPFIDSLHDRCLCILLEN